MDDIELIVSLAMDSKKYADDLTKSTKATSKWASGLGTVVAAGAAVAMAAIALLAGAIIGVGVAAFNIASQTNVAWNQFAAQTGAATSEMEGFKTTALDIFTSGFGDSIADIGESMAIVKQTTGATGKELESLTTKALIMRTVFGKDVQESIRAVDTAVINFGISGERAFDLVAGTIQKVGDPAGDLLDTVNEYSPVFAAAGFTADEMFGVLQAGLQAGARDFDVVADAVKEFQVRIIDGSDSTNDAMNTLLASTGRVSDEYVTLEAELKNTEAALEENTAALDDAEGAYAASKAVVDELSRSLSEARRELNELSRPNLVGMEDFNDQLFNLDQQSKQAKLSLLDMVEDSPEFEAAQKRLDDINKEMDKVALQRDITFDRQLRDIEKAAKDGENPLKTYDQVMAEIGAKKGEIEGLEGAFAGASAEMERNAAVVAALKGENEGLTTDIDNLKAGLEAIGSPAEQWLQGLADGSLSGRDAMAQVNEMLRNVDQETRDAVGPLLYGTKWEDLKDGIILSMDAGAEAIQDVEGVLASAGEQATSGLGGSFEKLKRRALAAIAPLGDKLLELAVMVMPLVEQGFSFLEGELPSIIETVSGWFDWLVEQINTNVIPFINDTLIPIFQEFGTWLTEEGIPAFLAFVTPIIEQVIPGLKLLGSLIFQYIQFWLPILVMWWGFLADNMNIILPIIAAVGLVILAITSPISIVIGLIVLLATAWANNWGGIQEKTKAVLDFIMPFVKKSMKFIQDTVVKVLNFVKAWWAAHGESVLVIVNALWDFILVFIDTQLKGIWAAIQFVLGLIQAFWDDWGQTIMLLTSLVWDNIVTIVTAAMNTLGFIIDAVAAVIQGDWAAFGAALKGAWNTAWEAIKRILGNAKTALVAVIKNIVRIIRDDYWQPFLDGLKAKWNALWEGLGEAVDKVVERIKTALQPITDLIDGMLTQIQNLLDNLPSLPGADSSSLAAVAGLSGRAGDTTNNFTQVNNFGDSSGFDSTGQFAQTEALLTT